MTNQENADLFRQEWLDGKPSFTIKTSGSTGTPKTIDVHRDQMIASAKKTIKALDLHEGMTSLVCLDVNFIAGKMMIVRSLLAGMKMMVVEPSSHPLENLGETNIDFAAMVPLQVMNSLQSKLPRKVIIGGAPVSSELIEKIKLTRGTSFYATFGMTETLSHIALRKINGGDAQDSFEVLEGVDIDADGRQCLVIKTDYLDDVVTTNDIVEIIDKKHFRWLGRYDNVINTGGAKVIPEKIEKLIEQSKLSNGFFVAGVDHPKLGQQVVVVIEGMLLREAESQLMEYLKGVLSKYEVPKQILYVNKFTLTSTDKVNRIDSLKNALPRPSSLQ